MDQKDVWDSWGNIHQEANQVKRINSAKKLECTPIKLDTDKLQGIFKGRTAVYETT